MEQQTNKQPPRADHQPWPSPATDPTNPHNQESIGLWAPNERASDRHNNEPGITDGERVRRTY